LTEAEIIDDVLKREGGYVNDPADRGGATNWGVTAKTLGEWRKLGRSATKEEVKKLTEAEARDIYQRRYVDPFAAVPFAELRAHLVDVGVNSGVLTAVKMLQQVLGVPVDGVLGERTKHAVAIVPWRLVNNGLVAIRVKHYATIAEEDATQRKFIRGWVNRAVTFIV
jgi:lysozyme family protein